MDERLRGGPRAAVVVVVVVVVGGGCAGKCGGQHLSSGKRVRGAVSG